MRMIFNSLLFCHINKNNLINIAVIFGNLTLLIGSILCNHMSFETQSFKARISLSVFPIIYTALFTYLYSDNMAQKLLKSINEKELMSYKQMFNSIQEGILVLNCVTDNI